MPETLRKMKSNNNHKRQDARKTKGADRITQLLFDYNGRCYGRQPLHTS
jgi:hypothetical protein